jgi:hypothetical protein
VSRSSESAGTAVRSHGFMECRSWGSLARCGASHTQRFPPSLPQSFIFPVLSMDAHTYPGRGLSLQQLVFALNQELKRVAYSPSYVSTSHPRLTKERASDLTTDSLRTRSPNLTGTLQPHWQRFASGGTPLFPSTASRWTSFPSYPPSSLPNGTVSAPLPSVAIGAEPAFIMVQSGLNYSSKKARSA